MAENPFDPAAITPETAQFVAELEAQLADLPATHEVPVDLLRKARDEGVGAFPFHPPLDEAEEITFAPAAGGPGRVRVLRPKGRPTGVFLHIHGGGWTLGRPWHQDHRLKNIVEQTGCATVSVEYRLAPEHPWPACVEDCAMAARWLLGAIGDQFQTERIVIGGESAGAHLAATTLLSMARENTLDRFHGALLTYGAYDMAMTPSTANWGSRQLILSTPTVAWFAGNLAIPADKMRDPMVSPLYGDLEGMPPALFQCGTYDPLLDDTAFMSSRWAAAGAEAEVIWYPGGVHAFDYFDTELAAKAHRDGIGFLRRVFR
jgi:acetyl esterase/lipase